MQITEVRIKLMESSEDRLRGFCSVTFDDCFVIRDLKIIEGNNGPFVAMPSRKLTFNCHKCRTKNHLRARYCNHCGSKQKHDHVVQDSDGRARLYADIAHPVNAACREMIQDHVIEEFKTELELSAQPGYTSRYDDDYNPTRKSEPLEASETPAERIDPAHKSVAESHIDKEPDSQNSPAPASDSASDEPGAAFGKGILD